MCAPLMRENDFLGVVYLDTSSLAQPFTPTDGRNDFDEFNALLAPRYCNFRKTTIYAGSNEIQRNIISKMTLGL